jgi:L,D-peptidoglycan transpeptidase YkuD (ErfK/YbiS/YcfS/YnhG family)
VFESIHCSASALVGRSGTEVNFKEGYQKVPILFNLPRRASHRNNDPSRRMW